MAHLFIMLFFTLLFLGCGAALQLLVGGHRREVEAALFGARVVRPAPREFRVKVRPGPLPLAA